MRSLRECDDCGEECPAERNRYRCVHCGMLVCGFCIGHSGHACGPGHSEKDCRDRKRLRAMAPEKRAGYLERLRARSIAAEASCAS